MSKVKFLGSVHSVPVRGLPPGQCRQRLTREHLDELSGEVYPAGTEYVPTSGGVDDIADKRYVTGTVVSP